MSLTRRWPLAALLILVVALVFPSLASADGPPPNHTLALPTDQLWTLLIGFIVPAGTYAINRLAPWVSEPARGTAMVVLAAIAGALGDLITTSSIGFDAQTLQFVVTAVLGALSAHRWFYRATGLNVKLGAGKNAGRQPTAQVGPQGRQRL